MIEGEIEFTEVSNLAGDHPQFTLTLVSTNGPTTTVGWHQNGQPLKQANSTSVLNDAVRARYTHTLTVSERLGGSYSIFLSNQKPSDQYRSTSIRGK